MITCFHNLVAKPLAISTAPDLSGSGRVDMPTRPVAAARAAVATGASGSIDTRDLFYTSKCGSLTFIFSHPPEDEYMYICIYTPEYIFKSLRLHVQQTHSHVIIIGRPSCLRLHVQQNTTCFHNNLVAKLRLHVPLLALQGVLFSLRVPCPHEALFRFVLEKVDLVGLPHPGRHADNKHSSTTYETRSIRYVPGIINT